MAAKTPVELRLEREVRQLQTSREQQIFEIREENPEEPGEGEAWIVVTTDAVYFRAMVNGLIWQVEMEPAYPTPV